MPSGRIPKPAGKAVGHRDHTVLALTPPRSTAVPPAPAGLQKATVRRWEGFWRSPVAAAADRVTDLPVIERLFVHYDELDRVGRAFRKQRVIAGRCGETMSPLFRYYTWLASEIRSCEDRLGLSPRARLSLGVALGEAKRSLHDLVDEVGYDD
jgi:hypothetical protein